MTGLKWTADDDRKLIQIVQNCRVELGKGFWVHVAREMDNGASPMQCNNHYKTLLPHEHRRQWTVDEMLTLIELVKKMPAVDWVSAAQESPFRGRRSPMQLASKWHRMKPFLQDETFFSTLLEDRDQSAKIAKY